MQKLQKNNLVFLIRAYNESLRIVSVIDGILTAGYTEIVVIDDGSTDETLSLVEENFGDRIHILSHVVNRGPGAALATGVAYISLNSYENNWRYAVTFDADGQMDIADMSNFMRYLDMHDDAQVIFGSRFIEKTDSNVPWMRRMTLFGGRIFTRIISGVNLTDAHNGYRMIDVCVLAEIHLTMDGMEYASELVDEIHRLGITIHEVPVNIHYDSYTLSKGQRFGGPIRIALSMIYKKIF